MIGDIWFGDQASYLDFIDKVKLSTDPIWLNSMRTVWRSEEDTRQTEDEEFQNRLLTRVGNTAVLTVSGSLTTNKQWYDSYLDWVSYEEIVEALQEATETEGVEQTVINYATGGGTANGIKSAGDYIQYVDRNVMPVFSHTSSASFSAGYWLYSAGRKATVEDMAQLGSIGALNIHVSYKDRLDTEGIVYTVFREGEFKALGQPFEKLDQKTKDYFQERLSKANAFFLDAVVRNRNVSMSNQSEWGEGKVHYGREAVAYGLADEITTLHELLGRFKTTQSGDGRLRYGGNMPKEKLEEQQAQATAADEAIAGLTPESRTDLSEAELAALEAGVPLAESIPSDGVEATAEADGEQLADEPADTAHAESLVALQAEVDGLKAQLETTETAMEEMKGIILDAANNKIVAMGGIPIDLSYLDAKAALTHYSNVDTKFKTTFKVGARSKAPEAAKPESITGSELAALPTAHERAFAHKRKQQ